VAPGAGSSDRLTFFAADLIKEQGWDTALAGCDYVLHVASPLGGDVSRDPNAFPHATGRCGCFVLRPKRVSSAW
jgi:hypothetical protein